MLRVFVVILLAVGISAPVRAQQAESMYSELQTAMEAAEAQAKRPGDEKLSCETLESELVAVANQPAVQSYVAKWGAAAQEQQRAIDEQMRAINKASNTASQLALTIFSSVVPGGAWAGLAAGMAQGAVQQAQTVANVQQRMAAAKEMIGVMPHIMRGQRLIELAQTRKCAWIEGQMPR